MKPVTNQIYHVLNKSIAGYEVFNCSADYTRFSSLLVYYQTQNKLSFSNFIKRNQYHTKLDDIKKSNKEKRIEIVAYCLMPTHFHFILKQLTDNGIVKFLNDSLNSYTRYFNTKYKRKGPLWQGRTKKVLVETDEQLLHLTRYLHLNPTTAYLVDNPQDWPYSSYQQYINEAQPGLCKFSDLIELDNQQYRQFVADNLDYQRQLKYIKDLIIEEA